MVRLSSRLTSMKNEKTLNLEGVVCMRIFFRFEFRDLPVINIYVINIYTYTYRESASRFSRGTVLNTLKQSGINILRGKKDATTFSRQAWFVKRFTKQACRENVVASFFPHKIFTYTYIYIFQQTLEQSKQTSKVSQLQNEKFEFTYNYFPCHLLTETR